MLSEKEGKHVAKCRLQKRQDIAGIKHNSECTKKVITDKLKEARENGKTCK